MFHNANATPKSSLQMGDRRLRVLFFASFFPKPANPWMGTWALPPAPALARPNIELLVVSCTSKFPSFLATTPGARAYANCPAEYTWPGNIRVVYPRWAYYPIPPFKQWTYKAPEPYLNVAWWSVRQQLCQLIEDFQPDILFCHHTLPNGWIVTHLPSHLQKPIITLDHDFDELEDGNLYPWRKQAMKRVADRAWGMLTVSQRMEKSLQKLFPHTQILTQHNGIDPLPPELFLKPRPPQLANKIIILSCALFAERKGISLLVEAFSQIAEKYPNAILRIIGSGPEEENIRQSITRFSRSQQIQMVGKLPHSQVLQEMVWSDCFALVGWDEPFATVYLEAMAAGKPIICCQDGGITDVVVDGIHGYTVPPRDINATTAALTRFLENTANLKTMGRNAQKMVLKNLIWDVKTQELTQLFEQAISQPQNLNAG
jgi:glycosyltransferase involved in cell wall biosynthesis